MSQSKKSNFESSDFRIPLFTETISAGFPSPADDYIDKKLDLNEHLIKNPSSSFLIKVKGDSMIDAGINSGDILIVDRSLEPADGKIVIGVIDNMGIGSFTFICYQRYDKKIFNFYACCCFTYIPYACVCLWMDFA